MINGLNGTSVLLFNRREVLTMAGIASISLLAGDVARALAVTDETTDIPVELELEGVVIDEESSMATVTVWAKNSGEKDYICVDAKIRFVDDDGFVSQTEEASFVGWLPAGRKATLEAEFPVPEGSQTVDLGGVTGAKEGECIEFQSEELRFVVLGSESNEAGVLADMLVLSIGFNTPTYNEVSLTVKAFDADGFTLGEYEIAVVDDATGPLLSGDMLRTNVIVSVEGADSFAIKGVASVETIDPRDYSRAYPFETVEFGSYPQATDNPTPVEWLVLDEKGSRKLLLAKYALDCKPYNDEQEDTTWEACTLRVWLDTEFFEQAFTEEEQARVAEVRLANEDDPDYETEGGPETYDRVFLLGLAEVEEYFGVEGGETSNDLICYPTDYAVEKGAYMNNENGGCYWWLRSPGFLPSNAAYVVSDGYVNSFGDYVHHDYIAVRPALWVSDL